MILHGLRKLLESQYITKQVGFRIPETLPGIPTQVHPSLEGEDGPGWGTQSGIVSLFSGLIVASAV